MVGDGFLVIFEGRGGGSKGFSNRGGRNLISRERVVAGKREREKEGGWGIATPTHKEGKPAERKEISGAGGRVIAVADGFWGLAGG